MNIDSDVIQASRTPLVKLRRASQETSCNIFGNAEFMNPAGQSMIARRYIIRDAIKRGALIPAIVIPPDFMRTKTCPFVTYSSGATQSMCHSDNLAEGEGGRCYARLPPAGHWNFISNRRPCSELLLR